MSNSIRELLYTAWRSELGIIVQTNDVTALRQKCYAERKKADDEDLSELSFVVSPFNPQTELWIVKK